MTAANKITVMRILLIPLFIMQALYYVRTGIETHRWLALLCFAVAAISDGIDGFIARRFNQRSELGAVLDPMADKLLLVSAIIILTLETPHLAGIPLWLTTLVISRDVILTIGLGIIYFSVGRATVRPHIIGKAATVLQMVSVLWVLLKWPADWLRFWALSAGACTVVSGLIYTVVGLRQIGSCPASMPSPVQDTRKEK